MGRLRSGTLLWLLEWAMGRILRVGTAFKQAPDRRLRNGRQEKPWISFYKFPPAPHGAPFLSFSGPFLVRFLARPKGKLAVPGWKSGPGIKSWGLFSRFLEIFPGSLADSPRQWRSGHCWVQSLHKVHHTGSCGWWTSKKSKFLGHHENSRKSQKSQNFTKF